MSLPLPRTVDYPVALPGNGHAGLWFDKFCHKWRVEGENWSIDGGRKLSWIETLTGTRLGASDQIGESVSRLIKLVERRGGRWFVLTAASRFVTGLGRSHPIENGFAWHPTLGTPYLPGSSIKGMVRAWAMQEGGIASRPAVNALFGRPASVGGISFLDAVPVEPVRVEADVMTPHYAAWSENDPPGDWRSPTPIPFLTMADGARFLFGIVPRRSASPRDLDVVGSWLSSALEWGRRGREDRGRLWQVRTGTRSGRRSSRNASRSEPLNWSAGSGLPS